MRKYYLHTVALALIWIGAIEVVASFLIKLWFEFELTMTPFFFLAILIGIVLYAASRIL